MVILCWDLGIRTSVGEVRPVFSGCPAKILFDITVTFSKQYLPNF